MISIGNKCMGCGACANNCPKKCIAMKLDASGFLYPDIDSKKCIDCNACNTVCPIINDVNVTDRIFPIAYAAKHNDIKVLSQSTSGGMFTAFSEKWGGIIFGAEMKNDELFCEEVKDNLQFSNMRGSKYVQCFTGDSYLKAEQYLQQNRKVLYFALPCQIAGLRNYLKRDYNNLLCVELICHGCPSTLLYKKHIQYLKKNYPFLEKVSHVDYKWTPTIERPLSIKTDNLTVSKDFTEDFYLWAFVKGYSYRPYCYECKFASLPRNADISIGDFFGYGITTKKALNPKNGISQVILNTEKGKDFFQSLDNISIQSCNLTACLFGNHNLWKPSINNSSKSEMIYNDIDLPFETLQEKYMGIENTKSKKLRRHIRKKYPTLTACLILLSYQLKGIRKRIKNEINKLNDIFS